jgi:hypothetical protein
MLLERAKQDEARRRREAIERELDRQAEQRLTDRRPDR